MDTAVYDLLMNAGPLGLFSIYLITKNNKLDEKLDKILSDARDTQDQQEAKALKREDQLRTRYDKVIDELRLKSETMRNSIVDKIDFLINNQNGLKKEVELMGISVDTLKDQMKEFQLKELVKREASKA
jgi:vacuolar-type H+-ATPase subunit H